MSRLYWMNAVIATTEAEYIGYTASSLTDYNPTSVQAGITTALTTPGGITKSKTLYKELRDNGVVTREATTEFNFTDSRFTDEMIVDYYSDAMVYITGYSYDSAEHRISFTCDPVELDDDVDSCKFYIVVKFL